MPETEDTSQPIASADTSDVAGGRSRLSFRGKVLIAAFVGLLAFWLIVGIAVVGLLPALPLLPARSR